MKAGDGWEFPGETPPEVKKDEVLEAPGKPWGNHLVRYWKKVRRSLRIDKYTVYIYMIYGEEINWKQKLGIERDTLWE